MNKKFLFTIAAFASLVALTHAKSFDAAAESIDQRLNDALEQHAALEAEIEKEKIPLAKKLTDLENQVLAKRADLKSLLKLRDSRTTKLDVLRSKVKSLEEQESFANSMLSQFLRDFEGRLDVSEFPQYEALTEAANTASAETQKAAQLDVVAAALARAEKQLGGYSYAGKALSPATGEVMDGTFVTMGPAVFYSSQDKQVFGYSVNQLNSVYPVVSLIREEGIAAGIPEVAASGKGTLPFDPSGKGQKMSKGKKTAKEFIQAGGIVGYAIIGLGLTALLIALLKAFEISSFHTAKPAQVDGLIDDILANNIKAATEKASSIGGTPGKMFTQGVEHHADKRGILEELMFEHILGVRPKLERFMPFLSLTAAAAPLMGLLGTVIGMIKTFELITILGTGDAKGLSSGISEALVTTALGLIVAIPILIIHGLLARMAKQKLAAMEQGAVAFVNGVTVIRQAKKNNDKNNEGESFEEPELANV